MAREPKYGVTINGWERLLVAFAANAEDLPHLDGHRVQLEAALDQLREAAAQQAAMRAAKQEASRRVESLLVSGRKVANFLRHGVRRKYGDSSEKLAEFDLKPFRGRRRKPEEEPPPAPTPEIAAPVAESSTASASEVEE